MSRIRLGVNIDHVATIRNARGAEYPDPARAAVVALEAGADVVAAACLIDRSAGEADVGVPLVALAQYKVPAYAADALPPELAAIPAVKPGSRGLA